MPGGTAAPPEGAGAAEQRTAQAWRLGVAATSALGALGPCPCGGTGHGNPSPGRAVASAPGSRVAPGGASGAFVFVCARMRVLEPEKAAG